MTGGEREHASNPEQQHQHHHVRGHHQLHGGISSAGRRSRDGGTGSVYFGLDESDETVQRLIEEGISTDVVIRTAGGVLHAHRSVLSGHSPVFRAMLSHDFREGRTAEVEIHDISRQAMAAVLRFLYSGNLPEHTDSTALVDMAAAAQKYMLYRLLDTCDSLLAQGPLTSVEDLRIQLDLATTYELPQLRESCMDYVASRLHRLVHLQPFRSVLRRNPIFLRDVVQRLLLGSAMEEVIVAAPGRLTRALHGMIGNETFADYVTEHPEPVMDLLDSLAGNRVTKTFK